MAAIVAPPTLGQVIQSGSRTVAGGASVYDLPGAATTYGAPGSDPWTIAFAPDGGLRFRFPSITGATGCGSGIEVGADGGACAAAGPFSPDGRMVVAGANGASGVWLSGDPARQMALMGVFQSSAAPGQPAPPVAYDSDGAYDFRTASPALNQVFFIGDGSVRFVDDGSSFRLGGRSARVITDGTSNTLLLGEGSVRYAGDDASGRVAQFGDGSVRFISDGLGG
jgi:hypothetical protein